MTGMGSGLLVSMHYSFDEGVEHTARWGLDFLTWSSAAEHYGTAGLRAAVWFHAGEAAFITDTHLRSDPISSLNRAPISSDVTAYPSRLREVQKASCGLPRR